MVIDKFMSEYFGPIISTRNLTKNWYWLYITTDASNKGNRKMFPFSEDIEIQDKLLYFYKDSKESSADNFNKINKKKIET